MTEAGTLRLTLSVIRIDSSWVDVYFVTCTFWNGTSEPSCRGLQRDASLRCGRVFWTKRAVLEHSLTLKTELFKAMVASIPW